MNRLLLFFFYYFDCRPQTHLTSHWQHYTHSHGLDGLTVNPNFLRPRFWDENSAFSGGRMEDGSITWGNKWVLQVVGIQDQCDAFVVLYFVWNLICKMYLEAVMACQSHLALENCTITSSRHTLFYRQWSYHRIQRHLLWWSKQKASSLRACAAQSFVLHLVQTFPAQLIWVLPLCCKHPDNDLNLDTTLRTRHVHPSIHLSSPHCFCLLLGISESLCAAVAFHSTWNDSVCKPDSPALLQLKTLNSQTWHTEAYVLTSASFISLSHFRRMSC